MYGGDRSVALEASRTIPKCRVAKESEPLSPTLFGTM
jgi:hypothetical protein